VTFHGGPVLHHPEVEFLLYGGVWGTDATLQGQSSQLEGFVQTLVNSGYMDMLNQYGVGRGSFIDAQVDTSVAPTTIDDTQLQPILAGDINSGLLVAPDRNTVYIILTPPGTEVTFKDSQGTLNTSGTEPNTPHFAGYHDAIPGTLKTSPAYYAVVPFPGGVNGSDSGLTTVQQVTVTISHELAEAATDPDTVGGWFDDSQSQNDGGEIADLANGGYGTVLNYDVQYIWSNTINQVILPEPRNLATVANDIVHSDEAYSDLIVFYYQQFLGRTPGQPEVNAWLNAFHRGVTDEQVESGFLASAEYYQSVGGTDKAWVDSIYQQLLQRPADAGGESNWLKALAAGESRNAIAYAIATSAEHESDLVAYYYQLYLGRDASANEIAGWVTAIQHGVTHEDIAADFLSSDESFYITNNSDISSWLTSVYQTVLGRNPEDAGLNSWTQFLDTGLQ
jgi:hypothetical protein